MIENLYEDLSVHLYEGEPITKKAPTPPPITYLTQWKIVGNSEVHTLPYPDGVVLPTGYKRCKYLEAHGTEYINLGYNTLLSYELKAQHTKVKERLNIILGNGGGAGQLIGFSANTGKWALGSKKLFTADSSQPQVVHIEFSQSGISATINNETLTDSSSVSTDKFYLFSIKDGKFSTNAKVFYLKAFNNGVLVHNWLPCLDDNNVPCLYDTVSGTSFYNDGTGTFGYEVVPQPTEIWSCGEYNPIDGKYHILVQPLGGSIVDIALTEPLRKVNNVADSIEFPSGTEGKALVTRYLASNDLSDLDYIQVSTNTTGIKRFRAPIEDIKNSTVNILTDVYDWSQGTYSCYEGINTSNQYIFIYDANYNQVGDTTAFVNHIRDSEIIYELATPTTELVDAPQIEEADSYSMVISQGGKAVSWSSFETNNE